MIPYTFKIVNLERSLPDEVVTTVHWTLSGTDGMNTESTYGSVGLAGDPTDPSFVPFEELTEDVVIEWVKGKLGTEQIESLKSSIEKMLAEKGAPTKVAGLPW